MQKTNEVSVAHRRPLPSEVKEFKTAKVSLFEAAATLAEVCNRLEEGEDLDEVLTEAFGESQALVAEAIDRRKAVINEIKSKIQLAKLYRKEINKHINTCKAVHQRIKDGVAYVMQKHPDQLYRDSLGKKLSIVKTPTPALKLDCDMRQTTSVRNVIDRDTIALLGIDAKYINEVSFTILDTEALKGDLLCGEEIPWARLVHSTHLRGL